MSEPRPPLMARVGRTYFARRSTTRRAAHSADALHELNAEERAGLKRVERGAIFRSAMAGALSGGACAAAELYADGRWAGQLVDSWLFLGAVTVVASVCEIAFIYWDTLRSVHELARVAGIELFGDARQQSDEALVDALARAALELPNPVTLDVGVNPHKEAKKWQLVLASFAYKAKVGVTNFLVKLFIRRVLGRVLVRGALRFLPFVSLPVTAAWNGIVSWRVLREARIRAMGPSAIEELIAGLFARVPSMSEAGRLSAVRAVASAIVRTQDLHPNLVRLLRVVAKRAGLSASAELDDVRAFLETLPSLAPAERDLSLDVLSIACIVDGRVTRRETRLWVEAMTAVQHPASPSTLEGLRRRFVRGEGFATFAWPSGAHRP